MIDLLHVLPPSLPEEDRWAARRRPPRHSDESLTGTTRAWLRRLPSNRRPMHLCRAFPRVANRIAWSWKDPQETARVLEELLADRRGGRRGFPRPVALELRRLRDYNDRGRDEAPPDGLLAQLRRTLAPG